MFTDIKAAIFDLDGTLIDSMWVWDQIDIDYLTSRGFQVPNNLKDEINHLSFEQCATYFKKRFNINSSEKDMLKEWNNSAYNYYANIIPLKKGAREILNYLKGKGIKIGLATSNNYSLINATLEHNKIKDYFETITTTGEVSNGKNKPDVYLLVANKLGVEPQNCIVFEDILEAVRGAKAANMKVVAVYDKAASYQRQTLEETADKYIMDYFELM
jgi:HAD superfamily hydrolase (TIGR01509 family)